MDLDIKLLTVLRKLNESLIDSLGKDLNEKGLTASEYTALVHLKEFGKDSIQNLARVSCITSGTATHLTSKLLKSGIIIKEQDCNDKRIYWIKITEKGKSFLNKVNETHIKYLKELLIDFTDEEKSDFIDRIKYFGINISKKQGE